MTLWVVKRRSGLELIHPSDPMLFQLLTIDEEVVKVWERKSGKVLLDKGGKR